MAMASDDNIRCAQCTFVVLHMFPEMLQDLLADTNNLPSTIYRMITRNHIFCTKHLNKSEWETVKTMKTKGFTELDVCLMYKIVKFFNLIDPPTRNWGANPLPNEHKLGDDIERIRRARNHLFHKSDANVSEKSFTEFFENSITISKRFDTHLKKPEGSSYEERIKTYKSCLLDKTAIEKLLEERQKEESLKTISTCSLESQQKEVHIMTGKSLNDVLERAKTLAGESVSPIKIIIDDINCSEENIDLINSFKEELSSDNITFKWAEKSCIILFAEVKKKALQDHTLFVKEVNCLINKVFRLCKLACKADDITHAVVTSAEEEFDQDNLEKIKEGGPSLFGNDDNLVLHADIKNSTFLSEERVKQVFTKLFDTVAKAGNGQQFLGKKAVHAVIVPDEGDLTVTMDQQLNKEKDEITDIIAKTNEDINIERVEDHLRANREIIEKEVYPKDNIDSFLQCSIFSIKDHEELRYKDNCRQHMAHSFLEKIMDPSYVIKGSIRHLVECFQTDNNIVLQYFATLMKSDLPVGISNFIDDECLQGLIKTRERCRNSILCNWTYLKDNFCPFYIMDDILGTGLVDEDTAKILQKDYNRRRQVDLILRNIVRRIDGPLKFSYFISILQKTGHVFIADKLQIEKTYGEKYRDFRQPLDLDVIDKKNRLKFFENDVLMELTSTDVDTFLEEHIFDVDDHEFIDEVAKNRTDMARCFYEKISDEKFIKKGSFECLVLCLQTSKTYYSKRLAELLISHQKSEQVKARTEITVKATDIVAYKRTISKLTEGVLKITIADKDIKDQVESKIVKVLELSDYKDKSIDGLKLIVKETTGSSVLDHLEYNDRNIKFIAEKDIDVDDLTRFIEHILDYENIKMHLSPGKKYGVSVSLRSTNNILETETLKGYLDDPKLRIINANRVMLEEEYDALPLLNAVNDRSGSKYKSLENLSPEYVSIFRNHLSEILKVQERCKRVQQFLDIAEDKIDADKLWDFIEDTANAFSLKKLRDDFHSLNSESKDNRYSAKSTERDTVLEGLYDVWKTEKDVKSPLTDESYVDETRVWCIKL